MNELQFDLVLHLAGEQIIPNYMGILACESQNHIIAATERTIAQVERLSKISTLAGKRISPLLIDAYDYPKIVSVLEAQLQAFPSQRIGVNITGGTKPMAAAALDVCRKGGHQPFYIDTQTKKIHLFSPPYPTIDLLPFFTETGIFVELAGMTSGQKGQTLSEVADLARRRLIRDFWQNRKFVQRSQADFAAATDRKCPKPRESFYKGLDTLLGWARCSAPSFEGHWEQVFSDPKEWFSAARFAGGGWLEEYVLMSLEGREGFLDVRMGKTVSFLDAERAEQLLQELDVSYTNGHELIIIECKAGQVKQDHIQKLENLSTRMGGTFGKGVLVAIDPPDETIRERMTMRGSRLSMICGPGADTEKLGKTLSMITSGKIYQT